MHDNTKPSRIHPLVAGAAVSVMLVSLTGVAAITGILPNSYSTASPIAPSPLVAQATAPAATSPTLAEMKAVAPAKAEPKAESKAKAATVAQQPKPVRTAQAPQPAKTYSPVAAPAAPVVQAPAICYSCGRVESVQVMQQAAQPSGLGMIAGAVIGGALGNQVGGGNGRKLATVAGAVGGGYAGNEIERNTRSSATYEVHVRMEGGEMRTFPYSQQPAWNPGDRVRIVDGHLASRA